MLIHFCGYLAIKCELYLLMFFFSRENTTFAFHCIEKREFVVTILLGGSRLRSTRKKLMYIPGPRQYGTQASFSSSSPKGSFLLDLANEGVDRQQFAVDVFLVLPNLNFGTLNGVKCAFVYLCVAFIIGVMIIF